MELYKKLNIDDVIYENIKKRLKRTPNAFETYLFSAMHSEHCGYMHSKKYLNGFYTDNNFENENSGCIKIKDYGIFFKIESHNHPCAIEPYQGSMTGIGGIIRDVLSLGARPLALLNSLKFGNLNLNKTKYYLDQVTKGISDYGNCTGIATISGETIFNKNFNNIPIVNVLALGLVKIDEIKLSSAKNDNLIILLGSKTGIDGLNGANFASNVLDENSSRKSVQIGDPYTKKKLIEAVLKINKLNEIVACQDLGASGILSSTSEMGYKGNCGIELYLDKVHTQNKNITPSEIMLSESQERMAFIINEKGVEKFKKITDEYELEYSIIGKTTEEKKYRCFYKEELLCDLDLEVLCEPYLFDLEKKQSTLQKEDKKETKTLKEKFNDLINDDNFSSKEYIYSQFDQEVQGRTALSQKENSIGVLYLKEVDSFIALACKTVLDKNSKQALYDSFMYLYKKMILSGFEPKGITNCLNFANPEDKNVQSDFLNAVDELKRLSHLYKIPVVSGNVSFYNENNSDKIPPCSTLAFVGVQKDKNQIANSEINLNDEIFFDSLDKNVVFDLIRKKIIKKAFPIGDLGLIGTILKEALFYNLGFKINTNEELYFKKYTESCVFVTDKKEELQKHLTKEHLYLGSFIDDKIIFDKYVYDKNEIREIYLNKIIKEME